MYQTNSPAESDHSACWCSCCGVCLFTLAGFFIGVGTVVGMISSEPEIPVTIQGAPDLTATSKVFFDTTTTPTGVFGNHSGSGFTGGTSYSSTSKAKSDAPREEGKPGAFSRLLYDIGVGSAILGVVYSYRSEISHGFLLLGFVALGLLLSTVLCHRTCICLARFVAFLKRLWKPILISGARAHPRHDDPPPVPPTQYHQSEPILLGGIHLGKSYNILLSDRRYAHFLSTMSNTTPWSRAAQSWISWRRAHAVAAGASDPFTHV